MNLKKKINAIVYTVKGDNSKDALLELENYSLIYKEKRLDIKGISKEEVEILAKSTEHGIMDLMNRQSREFKRIASRILDMSYKQVVDHIVENPTILKTPIVYTKKGIVVGLLIEDIENLAARIAGKRKKVEFDDWRNDKRAIKKN